MRILPGFNYLLVTVALLTWSCDRGSTGVQTQETIEQPTEAAASGWSKQEDSAFVHSAYLQGQKIVQYSKLMQQEASTPAVKSFAEQSAKWHQNINEEIQQLDTASTLSFTAQDSTEVQTALEELKKLPATEKESYYLELLSDVQENMIGQYEDASEKAGNMALREWTAKSLPSLEAHAQTVKELAQQLKDR